MLLSLDFLAQWLSPVIPRSSNMAGLLAMIGPGQGNKTGDQFEGSGGAAASLPQAAGSGAPGAQLSNSVASANGGTPLPAQQPANAGQNPALGQAPGTSGQPSTAPAVPGTGTGGPNLGYELMNASPAASAIAQMVTPGLTGRFNAYNASGNSMGSKLLSLTTQ